MHILICILRGINVSGKNLIKMDQLRLMMEDMGFRQIKTYIQSGNVVFQSTEGDTKQVATDIAAKITETFGFQVPVMVLDKAKIEQVANRNPYLRLEGIDRSKLHVTFLSGSPDSTLLEKIKSGDYQTDTFEVDENVIYLYCPGGYGNTKLSNNFFENKLKLQATTRNWNTVLELEKMGAQLV